MKTVEVTIAEKTYEIQALTIKPTRVWQQRAQQPLNMMLQAIESAQTTELSDIGSLVALAREVSTVLLGATDIVLELTLAYAPNLAADRDYIEENGYNEEIMTAFIEVLKMVYPLAQLTKLLGPRKR